MTQPRPRVGVYAGSFDPPTLGHLAIIQRAAKLFDQLHVVVGVSQSKRAWFSPRERIEMLQDACSQIENIEIAEHEGLTVAYARSKGADALVRGIRSGADYDYECSMAQMNLHLESQIETIFIPSSPEYFHISSTIVKDVASHRGELKGLVTPLVARFLSEKTKD